VTQPKIDILVNAAGQSYWAEYSFFNRNKLTKWHPERKCSVEFDINEGLAQNSLLVTMPTQAIDDIIHTNLLSVIYGTKAYLKPMMKLRQGCIINISSALGRKSVEGTSVYSASKAAISVFGRTMVKEISRYNIRINTILPGYIDTDMTLAMSEEARIYATKQTPLRRFGTAEEIASAALFLAINNFVTGTDLVIDGGISCI